MKKYFMFVFILTCNLYLITTEERIKHYSLDEKYEIDKKILQNFGNISAIYIYSNQIIVNGSERTPIETISFYYESDNNYFFLGKYDKYGIYNKNQELIYCNPYTESFIGYTEDILENPFYTGQYVNEDRFGPGAFEPYVNIQIDFQNNTITLKTDK